jgi:hypothetical protein
VVVVVVYVLRCSSLDYNHSQRMNAIRMHPRSQRYKLLVLFHLKKQQHHKYNNAYRQLKVYHVPRKSCISLYLGHSSLVKVIHLVDSYHLHTSHQLILAA